MPELPEVETVVRTLRPHLVGWTIAAARLLRNDIVKSPGTDLCQQTAGRSVVSVERRGKKILICLDNGKALCIHLGMTGHLTVEPANAPLRPHTHLILQLCDATNGHGKPHGSVQDNPLVPLSPFPLVSHPELRFADPRRFGGVWLLDTCDCANANLGPEPLSLSTECLAKCLSRTRRPIKSALLDQSVIAGLGNIYVDESLFASGIHPLTPASSLSPDQIARLNQSIKRIVRHAIRHRGSSISDYIDVNGESGRFQNLHKVYARENKPCRTCKTPIQRIILSGRSTHFCPKCQPEM